MWNEILYNKRTSICGVIVAGAVFFRIFFPQKEALINQLVEALIGLVGAAGLLLAKDGGKSGTASSPNP
jgi:hypothetical protein